MAGDRKIWFKSDYQQGAHPKIIERLAQTAEEPLSGYGEDRYTEGAQEKIRKACGCDEAEVVFLTGGTQTNQIAISTLLQSYEGVIAADTGHINVHEAGAIEYSGHKVLTVKGRAGKMDAGELLELIRNFQADDSYEHTVYPGMVYISYPTELGTLYTKRELEAISEVCREYKIPLYLDGARLSYGLMSKESDLDLETIAKLCDVFYIGGTKVGAFCGEALVFTKGNKPRAFVPRIKQRGALLAKGFLNSIQFDTLFTDGLYFEIGQHAIEMANILKEGVIAKGYELYADSPTNQQFVILPNDKCRELSERVVFENWCKLDGERTAVRFVTGWATKKEDVEELILLL